MLGLYKKVLEILKSMFSCACVAVIVSTLLRVFGHGLISEKLVTGFCVSSVLESRVAT